MIGNPIKNTDSLQLQQTIIHLKSELAKYKQKVEKYQDDNQSAIIEKIKYANGELQLEKNDLAEELVRLNRELVKRTSESKEQLQFHETLRKEQLNTIESLQQSQKDLLSTNQQLTAALDKLKAGWETKQTNDQQDFSLHRKMNEYKTTIKRLEQTIASKFQDTNKLLLDKIDELSILNVQQSQEDKVKLHLLKELEKKNRVIDKLKMEQTEAIRKYDAVVLELSQQKEQSVNIQSSPTALSPSIDTDIVSQLDQQIRKILAQSLDYEEQLATKQLTLHALEQKLEQLTVDVDDIKIFGVSGQIVKEN